MVRIPAAIRARIAKLRAERKCLGCEKQFDQDPDGNTVERVVRGCCMACYTAINRAIQRGSAKEPDLIRRGKLLPKTRGGRRPKNAMSIELAEG